MMIRPLQLAEWKQVDKVRDDAGLASTVTKEQEHASLLSHYTMLIIIY